MLPEASASRGWERERERERDRCVEVFQCWRCLVEVESFRVESCRFFFLMVLGCGWERVCG